MISIAPFSSKLPRLALYSKVIAGLRIRSPWQSIICSDFGQVICVGGLSNTVAGQTIGRQCSSGLMATAAKQIIVDGQTIAVAGGHENISEIQNAFLKWVGDEHDPNVIARAEHAYMSM